MHNASPAQKPARIFGPRNNPNTKHNMRRRKSKTFQWTKLTTRTTSCRRCCSDLAAKHLPVRPDVGGVAALPFGHPVGLLGHPVRSGRLGRRLGLRHRRHQEEALEARLRAGFVPRDVRLEIEQVGGAAGGWAGRGGSGGGGSGRRGGRHLDGFEFHGHGLFYLRLSFVRRCYENRKDEVLGSLKSSIRSVAERSRLPFPIFVRQQLEIWKCENE